MCLHPNTTPHPSRRCVITTLLRAVANIQRFPEDMAKKIDTLIFKVSREFIQHFFIIYNVIFSVQSLQINY